MKDLDVLNQSKCAMKQWGEQWKKHAKHHARFVMKDLLDFQNSGIGKAALVIANGYSFEKNLDVIKKHQHNVDIICVDKCLKPCLENGIVPKFCLVADANVNYEKYMKPVEDLLRETTIFMNVCGNPKWVDNGNWKDRYFYVNKDVLKSEHEFMQLSGCPNVIPAGTNVSNAAVVILTQCDERGRNNYFGYDKILLIGFDYCWNEQSYYAFDKNGEGKANYMKSVYMISLNGEMVYTSPNLLFSAKWLEKYITVFKIPAIQCSKDSIFSGYKTGTLSEQMQYRYKAEDASKVISLLESRRRLSAKIEEINREILGVGRDHFQQLMRTI